MQILLKTSTFFILILCVIKLALADVTLQYEIKGVPDDIEKNIQSRLQSEQQLYPKPLTRQSIESLYNNASSTVLSSVEPYGYFNAKITQQKLKTVDKHKSLATIKVSLGKPLKVNKLDVTISGPGMNNKEFQHLLANLPIAQGDNLNMEKYNKLKFDLTNIAAEKGFLAAKLVKHAIYIDRENYTSECVIHFDTGPQYYFGQVQFQNSFYDTNFLNRFVPFKTGEEFSSDSLQKLQQSMNSTIYFSQVVVQPDEQQAKNFQVPIIVDLETSKSQAYNFGLGYGTDTGIRGTADGEWRHLTDTGHYFKAFLQASEVQSSAMARYIIPGKNPVTDQFYFGASFDQQNYNNGGSKGDTEKINIGHVDEYKFWQRTVALNYQWDQYSINRQPFVPTHLLLPSLTLFHSKADNFVFPRNGRRLSIDILGAAKPLISSNTFVQAEVDGKYIFSPTENSRAILRGDVGITVTDNINLVPLSLQFFAGGANSIRGYRYQELGPGRYLIVGSAEIQHQVTGNWWGALFIDAGNAVNKLTNPGGSSIGRPPGGINLSQILKFSPGVGVVYVSPVGPIEVTLAKAISDPKQPLRLQFTMGSNL